MKKLTIITAVAGIFLAHSNVKAQGPYVGLNLGYGMPSMVGSFYPNTSQSNGGSISYTSQSISLGSGMQVQVYGGYMVTKNFGFELGISDKFSSSHTATQTSTDTGFFGGTDTHNYTVKGGLFRLTPALRVVVGEGKLQTYMVTGLIIGFPMSVTSEDNATFVTTSSTNTSDQIWTYSGGMIWGFHGAVGVVYMVSDKIGIFGELAGNFQNWAPGKEVLTTATVNGADQLAQMTTSQKETDFVSSFNTPTTATPGSPSQSTQVYIPFSSFGINVGVHISFGGGSSN